MSRLRGRRLADLNRADFEQLEERVERRELDRYLREREDAEAAEEARRQRWEDQ